MARRRFRSSLLVRLLVVSVVVALCAIAATAWLAAKTTTVAITQQQGQALADDAKIYDTLIGYAATHNEWAGVGPVVAQLVKDTGRRIELSTQDRKPIAGEGPLPDKASAVIDPLAVDPALATDADANRIDKRAVGPYLLTPDEKAALDQSAQVVLACVRGRSGDGSIVETPSGRPVVQAPNEASLNGCQRLPLSGPVGTEVRALNQLTDLTNRCLASRNVAPVRVNLDGTYKFTASAPAQAEPSRANEIVVSCIASARHDQLVPYVAPAALLFVASPASQASAGLDLSPANKARIIGVAALVLLVAVLATVFAGGRLVRPLRALTGAAQRMRDGDDTARVRLKGSDEIAQLALAFNEMADIRSRNEEQRKAMVSDIAHELRTPLSNIRGWLEAVEDGVTKPDKAFVASMMEEALLLQHIVDDLQDLAMADAGKLRIHPEHVHLSAILSQVAAAQKPKDVHLFVRTEGEPELAADPVRLRQAVGNLVTNALRHTPPGGSVTIAGRQEGPWTVIDVIDTGAGIGPDDLPKVFDRFWRAEKSRSRQGGGSGLGLAIVRKLAEAHGGTVSVASTLGEGSTFTLRLPSEGTTGS